MEPETGAVIPAAEERDPAPYLAALTAALIGRACRAQQREGDWNLDFGDGVSVNLVTPWRIVGASGVVFGAEDEAGDANDLLDGRVVEHVEIEPPTRDLRLGFDGGLRLELFIHSAIYSSWQALFPFADTEAALSVIAGGDFWISLRSDFEPRRPDQ